jgi:hypothetical protein
MNVINVVRLFPLPVGVSKMAAALSGEVNEMKNIGLYGVNSQSANPSIRQFVNSMSQLANL